VAQLGARLDGIEEVVGSNPIGSTKILLSRTACTFFNLSLATPYHIYILPNNALGISRDWANVDSRIDPHRR
jgi:hypothetical protein